MWEFEEDKDGHDEPGCFDPIFLRWIQDSIAGRTPQIDRIGISYM
jgi:hypothetical protein